MLYMYIFIILHFCIDIFYVYLPPNLHGICTVVFLYHTDFVTEYKIILKQHH